MLTNPHKNDTATKTDFATPKDEVWKCANMSQYFQIYGCNGDILLNPKLHDYTHHTDNEDSDLCKIMQ